MDFFPLEIETFLINSEKGIKVDPQTENSWRGRVLKNLFVFFFNCKFSNSPHAFLTTEYFHLGLKSHVGCGS